MIKPNYQKCSGGFTLLEVLIASLLLFVAIGLASVSYQAGLKSKVTAAKHISHSVALGFIRNEIDEALRVQPTVKSGEGVWGKIEYRWRIDKQFEKSAKAGTDLESGSFVELGQKLLLSEIIIEMNTDEYVYTHLSWQ